MKPRKSVVIHMGVSLPNRQERQPAPPTDPILLCPANLFPVKGHRYLIEAMRILKERGVACRLDVVGDGELHGRLKALVRQLGVDDRIQFTGHVPHEELLRTYADPGVAMVVLPSIDLGNHLHEGIPVCLIEAMSYGVPVVSTNTGGIPEFLENGAGVIVPDKDARALADAVASLLADRQLRDRLVAAGRRRVEEQFSVEAGMKRFTELLQKAAAG